MSLKHDNIGIISYGYSSNCNIASLEIRVLYAIKTSSIWKILIKKVNDAVDAHNSIDHTLSVKDSISRQLHGFHAMKNKLPISLRR